MRILMRAALVVAAMALAGCANFKAVKEFAGETTEMTGALKQELKAVAGLCTDTADMRLLLAESGAGATDLPQKAKAQCVSETELVIAYQAVTVDVLDLYAKTLLAMADDKNFALEASIDATGKKIQALKSRDGEAVFNAKKVGALAKVLSLLADVIVQRQREDGIRKLVQVGPDLAENAQQIKSFLSLEYQGRVSRAGTFASGSVAVLQPSESLAQREPIRAAELRRSLAKTTVELNKRKEGGEVPARLIAMIDAWIALIPEFQREALQPEPLALIQKIRDFGKKAGEAKQAVEAAF